MKCDGAKVDIIPTSDEQIHRSRNMNKLIEFRMLEQSIEWIDSGFWKLDRNNLKNLCVDRRTEPLMFTNEIYVSDVVRLWGWIDEDDVRSRQDVNDDHLVSERGI